MSRPTLEVADIIQAQGNRFVDCHRRQLSYQQLKVLRAIARCRTAALGGHVDDCPRCGYKAISYNSCRNRHCPKCQAQARQRWLATREQELLGVPYFHVVFTLPHELIPLCQRNPKILYDLLFRASAATMLEVAAKPKHLGAEIGFLSILHTWGQNLLLHPHVHCVIPAGGFSADHTRWIHPKYSFFLPVRVLSRVFRGKFIAGLKRAFRKKRIHFLGAMAVLDEPSRFAAFSAQAVPPGLGGVCQTGVRRSRAGAAVSRPIHPSRCHQQSSAAGFRRGTRHLSLEGLCTRQQAAKDDAFCNGVSAAIPPTRITAELRPHSPLRLPRQ